MTHHGLPAWADALTQDLRHAWRTAVAEKGLTAVVVVVLALGSAPTPPCSGSSTDSS